MLMVCDWRGVNWIGGLSVSWSVSGGVCDGDLLSLSCLVVGGGLRYRVGELERDSEWIDFLGSGEKDLRGGVSLGEGGDCGFSFFLFPWRCLRFLCISF